MSIRTINYFCKRFHGRFLEAVSWKCSVKKVFLKISQNLQKNTFAKVTLLIKLKDLRPQTLLEIDSNTGVSWPARLTINIRPWVFFYRTPPVAASINASLHTLLTPFKFLYRELAGKIVSPYWCF